MADTDLMVHENVPLAPYTTMKVGGPARFFVDAASEETVLAALGWSQRRGLPFLALGGGSNLVVDDEGVDALVVKIALRGIEIHEHGARIELTVAAGEPWDDLVGLTVARGWAGLECLSGIPGLVGATPIQNVGAYGQDVSETVTAVRAVDRRTGRITMLAKGDCGFAYRDSRFKTGEPGRWLVLSVAYRLAAGGAAAVRYEDVERFLAARGRATPSLADVREAVLAIRRSKSMVLDENDENRRSCGSFFVNPIVSRDELRAIEARVGDGTMPRWPERDGRVKLSAAWLIERAGFHRGSAVGPVGISTRHALAIVAHDGARACDVLALAGRVHRVVAERLGVSLTPEPVVWGRPSITG